MAFLSSPVAVLAFLLLFLTALALLLRSLYPRRRGTTPHCRRCSYDLTGSNRTAAAARCPECGADITSDRAIVQGERHRRAGLIGVALLLTVLTFAAVAFTGFHWAHSVDWYRWKPTVWVCDDSASPTLGVADRAYRELIRRYDAGELSHVHFERLARSGLADHAATAKPMLIRQYAADLLGRMIRNGRLSEADTSQFLDNLSAFSATVRQPLVEGMDAVVDWRSTTPGPSGVLTRSQFSAHPIEGGVNTSGGSFGSSSVGGGPLPGGPVRLSRLRAGEHRHTCLVRVRIFDTDQLGNVPDRPIAEKSTMLETIVKIPPGNPADYIVAIDSPDLREEYRNAIDMTRVVQGECDQRFGAYPIEIQFPISRPLPFWFLAHGELDVDGRRFPLSAINVGPGMEPHNSWKLSGHVRDELPDRVTVILNCRRDWAERAADYLEYVAGEIRFEGVPVVRPPRASGSRPNVQP